VYQRFVTGTRGAFAAGFACVSKENAMNRMRPALVMAACILMAACSCAAAGPLGEFPWQTSGVIRVPPVPVR
jgi:hypothetical protein